MLKFTNHRRKQYGFTIVELLIVIVVIAILAAISIVAYNGIQQRARDTQRKSDVANIVKLLHVYEIDNGPMYTDSGCGANGNGAGWFNHPYSPSSIAGCLTGTGYVSAEIIDPSGSKTCSSGVDCHAYMKYTCTIGGNVVTYVYANLETVAHTTTDTDGTCAATLDSVYGMNYVVKVN